MPHVILTAYVSTIHAGFIPACVARVFDVQPGTYSGNRAGREYVAMCRRIGTGERANVRHAVELFRTYIGAMIRGAGSLPELFSVEIQQGTPSGCDVDYVDDLNRSPLTIAQGNAIAKATIARAESMRARLTVAPVATVRPVPSPVVAPFDDAVVMGAMFLFAPRNRQGDPYVAASQS